MLRIENLEAARGDTRVLEGVSLEVGNGEIVCLIGRNGMGKTTLLRSIVGLTQVLGGEMTFEDADLRDMSTHQIARLGIGVVPEGRHVFSELTVLENLCLALGRRVDEDDSAFAFAFELFPVLKERSTAGAGTLSGGQQQMLAIARALVKEARLLLVDEFSEGIQPSIVRQIADVLRVLNEKGTSILLVEQNARLALGVADRGYVMEKGKIVTEGVATEMLADEESLRRQLVI